MDEIFEDSIVKGNQYYIETDPYYRLNNNTLNGKQIGVYSKLLDYPFVGKYYNFSYSKDITNKYSGRLSGENTFGVEFTKIFIPKKNKLLFLQVMRQKIKDKFFINYIIKLSYL